MAMLDSHTPDPVEADPYDPVGREMRMAAARERRAQVLAEQGAPYPDPEAPSSEGGRWQVVAALALGLLVGVGTVMVARTLAYRDLPPPARVGMVPAPKPATPAPAPTSALPAGAQPEGAAPAAVAPTADQAGAAGGSVVPPSPATGDTLRPMARPPAHVVPARPAAAGAGTTQRRAAPTTTAPASKSGNAQSAQPVAAPPAGSLGRAIAGINALTIGKAAEAMGVGGRVGPIVVDDKGVRVRPPSN